jgi:hypothetical protein
MDGWFGGGGTWDADALERERAEVARREGRERLPATAAQLAAYAEWRKAEAHKDAQKGTRK